MSDSDDSNQGRPSSTKKRRKFQEASIDMPIRNSPAESRSPSPALPSRLDRIPSPTSLGASSRVEPTPLSTASKSGANHNGNRDNGVDTRRKSPLDGKHDDTARRRRNSSRHSRTPSPSVKRRHSRTSRSPLVKKRRSRSQSRSRSPVNRRRRSKSRSPFRKRRSPSPVNKKRRSRSRSPVNKKRRSRSRSPVNKYSKKRRSRSRSPVNKKRRSRSRSPRKNRRSKSPRHRRSRSRSRDRRRSRSPPRRKNWDRFSRSPSPMFTSKWGMKRSSGITRSVLPADHGEKKAHTLTTEEVEAKVAKHMTTVRQKAAVEAKNINLPGYLNPAMINVHQFKQVQDKRKLLWSKPKDKKEGATQWAGAFNDHNNDEKFKRFMGIQGIEVEADSSKAEQSRRVLTELEKEFEKSRAFQLSRGAGGVTGMGLGFGAMAPP